MKMEVWPPGPPVCTTFKPGTVFKVSGKVRYCWVAMSCAVIAVIEFATWLVGVAIAVGLMTVGAVFGMPCCGVTGFSGFCRVGAAAARREAGFCSGAGCVAGGFLGGLTSTGGNRSGDADGCAWAAGMTKGSSDDSIVDASKLRRNAPALMMEDMARPRYDVSGTSQRTKSHRPAHAVQVKLMSVLPDRHL